MLIFDMETRINQLKQQIAEYEKAEHDLNEGLIESLKNLKKDVANFYKDATDKIALFSMTIEKLKKELKSLEQKEAKKDIKNPSVFDKLRKCVSKKCNVKNENKKELV